MAVPVHRLRRAEVLKKDIKIVKQKEKLVGSEVFDDTEA